MIGKVVSTKTKNTATVLVERTAKHPLYKKTFIRSKRFLVDDQIGVKMGDVVEVIKTKPISKNKHWKITKVLGGSLVEIAKEQMKEKAAAVIAEVMPEEKEGDKQSLPSLREGRVQGISRASLSSRTGNVGSSEETVEDKKTENKIEKKRKEKLAPKP